LLVGVLLHAPNPRSFPSAVPMEYPEMPMHVYDYYDMAFAAYMFVNLPG
jgi:hypothetical protein